MNGTIEGSIASLRQVSADVDELERTYRLLATGSADFDDVVLGSNHDAISVTYEPDVGPADPISSDFKPYRFTTSKAKNRVGDRPAYVLVGQNQSETHAYLLVALVNQRWRIMPSLYLGDYTEITLAEALIAWYAAG